MQAPETRYCCACSSYSEPYTDRHSEGHIQSVLDIVKDVLGRLLKCLSHILPRFCTGL